jgi:two-component sensor histidine kinase
LSSDTANIEELALNVAFDYPRVAATVKRLLSERSPGADVSLGPFLRDITDQILTASGPGGRTHLAHSHARGSAVSAANAAPIGLIVGELVANAVHYAHPAGVPGQIDVSSTTPGAGRPSSIEVKDDGVGLPEAFDTLSDGGAGLGAVRQLANQLGAGLEFNDLGVGLSVRLDLPFALCAGAASAEEAA